MKEDFDKSLQLVLVHEGGFVNHPRDPGGATMKGVTLETFRRYFGADKTVNDLRNITQAQLAHVYRTGYWDKCKCDQLPVGIDYAVFDVAVNSGPGRAAKFLQAAVGVAQDGAIGPGTLGKVETRDPPSIIDSICNQRLAFLQGLETFSTFGVGWTKRVAGVRQQALDMARGAPDSGSSAPGTGSAVAAPSVNFDIVRRGSEGEWVVKLQKALGVGADGKFGAATEAALKAFQEAHGLHADGIAGRNTYRALGLIE
jgi:lysozyme family protein